MTELPRAHELARRLIGALHVVPGAVEVALREALAEVWEPNAAERVRAGGYRRGVLHVVVDSHARLAEARAFWTEAIRGAVNENLRRAGAREYVTRLVFHLEGTR